MNESLRQNIAQNYGSECWEPITGKLWNGNVGFQFFKFERDVEHEGKNYCCIIINKCVYDAELSIEDVDYDEDVFAEAWEL